MIICQYKTFFVILNILQLDRVAVYKLNKIDKTKTLLTDYVILKYNACKKSIMRLSLLRNLQIPLFVHKTEWLNESFYQGVEFWPKSFR